MNWPHVNAKPRQIVLAILTGLMALCALATERYLLPAWDELVAQRVVAKAQALEYEKLTRHLAVADAVAAEFQQWGWPLVQSNTDEVMLASLLRSLEAKARVPGVNIVNIKPVPVSDEGVYKLYRVHFSLSGKLPDILRYAGEITGGGEGTGIDSFSIRGTPRPDTVECLLLLRTVRLVGGQAVGGSHAKTAPSTQEFQPHGQ